MSRYYRSILNVQAAAPAFVPTDIAGCQLWLDAADSSTISIGTGVSQWDDKSGNARHATQAVAASQPAYSLAAVNGKNAINFDGSNDVLNTGTFTIASPYTIIFAEKIDSTDTTQVLFDAATGLNTVSIYTFQGDYRASSGGTDSNVGATDSNTKAHYWAIDGVNSYYARDNGAKTTLNWGTTSLPSFRIGANRILTAGFYLKGFALEAIIYNKKLLDIELGQIQNYLATKWGI